MELTNKTILITLLACFILMFSNKENYGIVSMPPSRLQYNQGSGDDLDAGGRWAMNQPLFSHF